MTTGPALRRLCGLAAEPPDGELVRRFGRDRDEAAFAALVRRHGRLVLGVCRNVLGHAEDAFQATFLLLAEKAATLRDPGRLAAWLHGVARRTALRARRDAARRRDRERRPRPAPPAPTPGEATVRELQAILDEEVARLPEAYRSVFVLCALESSSTAKVAGLLGWKPGTVSGRLSRARRLLLERLARRGVTLLAALTAAALAAHSAGAAVPRALAAATARAAGQASAAAAARLGLVSERVPPLVRGPGVTNWKAVLAAVLTAGLAAGLAAGSRATPGDAPPPAPPSAVPAAPGNSGPRPGRDAYGDPLPAGAVARLGTVRLRPGNNVKLLTELPGGKGWLSVVIEEERVAVCQWDGGSGRLLRRFTAPERFLRDAALSPDGRLLALAGTGGRGTPGKIAAWDVASGKEVRTLAEQPAVTAFAWSPDGTVLAAGGDKTPPSLYDSASGAELRRLPGHYFGVNALAFLPDGRRLASGSVGGVLRVWNAATGKELLPFAEHESYVRSVAWSPDGRTLATGGLDGTIRLWEPASGKAARTLEGGHQERVWRVTYSPDGRSLASGGKTAPPASGTPPRGAKGTA